MLKVIILIAGITNFFLGYIAWRNNPKGKINTAFGLLGFSTSAWAIFNFLFEIFQNVTLLRSAYAFGALVPTIGLFWLLYLGENVIKKKLLKVKALIILIGVFLFIASYIPNFIVTGNYNSVLRIIHVQTGPFYYVYSVLAFALIASLLIVTFFIHSRAEGIIRNQSKYILIGVWSFSLIALFVSFILPLFGFINLAKLDSPSSLLFVGFSAYAIVRHRLMDIRVIIRRSFIFFGLGLFVVIGYYGVLWLDNHFFGGSYSIAGYFSALFIAPVFLWLFSWLRQWFDRIANRYFFTSLYNYQTTLEELARQLTSVIELHRVIDLIVGSIMQTMGLDRAGVLLLSGEKNSKKYTIAKVIGFNEQNGISLVRNNFLVQWLGQNRKLVVWEELGMLIDETISADERSQLMRLKTNMTKIEASICLPLFSKDQLIGIIVLGNKVTGDAYTSEDLRLLQSITNQAAVAIQNARLYDQVQDFSLTLQEKVREQTKDIEEKNQRLQDLLHMKSEFLTIASHQLRTPLTAIRGLLAMQVDGDFDKLPKEEIKKEQAHMLDSANRLSNIVNDLLKAMELEGGGS